MGDLLRDLDTPAVLLDLEKLESNLTDMQRRADDHDVALRPHAKTHKSIEIGRRQLALGAVGLTVATVEEALVFLRGGGSDERGSAAAGTPSLPTPGP